MKTLLKLLIAAATINAAARCGFAAWNYYQLKDAAQQLAVFGAMATTDQLHGEILAKAQELKLPVTYDDVSVRRDGMRTFASVSYVDPIELFPRYQYPMRFSFNVEAFSTRPPTPEDTLPR